MSKNSAAVVKNKAVKPSRNKEDNIRIWRLFRFVILVLLVAIMARGVINIFSLKIQQSEAEQQYQEKVDEKARLEVTLNYINTPEYIEQVARDKLKMVMPGEILYVLKDANTVESGDGAE